MYFCFVVFCTLSVGFVCWYCCGADCCYFVCVRVFEYLVRCMQRCYLVLIVFVFCLLLVFLLDFRLVGLCNSCYFAFIVVLVCWCLIACVFCFACRVLFLLELWFVIYGCLVVAISCFGLTCCLFGL